MSLISGKSSAVAQRIWIGGMVAGMVSSPFSRLRRGSGAGVVVAGELAVDIDLRAVDLDVAALSQVHHHVPVQARLVLVSGLGVAGPEGEVDGAADLFVEQRVARVATDLVVGADRALAEETAAGVH